MSQAILIIPKSHTELLGSILTKMGCEDFKKNENKYAPDFTFSVGTENYWGYAKGFTVEFGGTDANTLTIINQQYESILKELQKQEKQD